MAEPLRMSRPGWRPSFGRAVLLTGGLAGLLDISGAMLHYAVVTGKNPVAVLPFVASGVFGQAAFSGAPSMIGWGLLFHFFIALVFTAVYFLVYPKLGLSAKSRFLAGVVYGALVWSIMTLVVVTLSNVPHRPLTFKGSSVGMLIIMACIGLPIAYRAHNFYVHAAEPARY